MTAMCDVAFLLLTFFMLATKFKPAEPVHVETPKSISDIMLPGRNIMLITVGAEGKVFFAIDDTVLDKASGRSARKELIDSIYARQSWKISDVEEKAFNSGPSIGIPFSQLQSFLSASTADQKALIENAPGIPVDTSADDPKNELAQWIRSARHVNPYLRICIKADKGTSYPSVHKVIKTMEGMKIFKFNLITSLEMKPNAYYDAHPEEKANKK
jgi:biopolymer transport protein ExbD